VTTVDDCKLIELPKITDHRGNLTFAESERHIPFRVERAFWIYDVPTGVARGAHAHRGLHQLLICMSGGLDVHLDDGERHRTVHLARPWIGLHVPPMIWASEANFDTNTVYMVLASDRYDESDYFRDYADFLAAVRSSG
jgi:dTDP-4-dehydrorhamnose 3,5-epimerase-like enzyme